MVLMDRDMHAPDCPRWSNVTDPDARCTCLLPEYLAAAESEAVRQALSELEEEVGGLNNASGNSYFRTDSAGGPMIEIVDKAAVIKLIHKKGADL